MKWQLGIKRNKRKVSDMDAMKEIENDLKKQGYHEQLRYSFKMMDIKIDNLEWCLTEYLSHKSEQIRSLQKQVRNLQKQMKKITNIDD